MGPKVVAEGLLGSVGFIGFKDFWLWFCRVFQGVTGVYRAYQGFCRVLQGVV